MVIDEEGNQLGELPTREALEIAQDRGLDLVEVAEKANPPVCKIMDYGKFKYQQQKRKQEAKKEADCNPDQGSQIPPQDRRARLPDKAQAHPSVSRRRRQVQSHYIFPGP